MSRRFAPFLCMVALSGCATVPDATDAVCRGEGLESFIGRPADSAMGAEIMRMSGAGKLQWVAAGGMVTMEHRQDRVRVHLDARNLIARIDCG